MTCEVMFASSLLTVYICGDIMNASKHQGGLRCQSNRIDVIWVFNSILLFFHRGHESGEADKSI